MNDTMQNQAIATSKPQQRHDFKVRQAYQVLLKGYFRKRFRVNTDHQSIQEHSNVLKESGHE